VTHSLVLATSISLLPQSARVAVSIHGSPVGKVTRFVRQGPTNSRCVRLAECALCLAFFAAVGGGFGTLQPVQVVLSQAQMR
jgi:hypothetical protein